MSTLATSPRPTLLLVDDEAVVTAFLDEHLTESGFAVTVVTSAAEALAEAMRRRFDLVVAEQSLSGPGPMELLKQLLAHDATARVVLVSASGSVEFALNALIAGATDCIVKPADDLVSFVGRLKRALDRPRVASDVLATLDPKTLPAGTREAMRALRQAIGG